MLVYQRVGKQMKMRRTLQLSSTFRLQSLHMSSPFDRFWGKVWQCVLTLSSRQHMHPQSPAIATQVSCLSLSLLALFWLPWTTKNSVIGFFHLPAIAKCWCLCTTLNGLVLLGKSSPETPETMVIDRRFRLKRSHHPTVPEKRGRKPGISLNGDRMVESMGSSHRHIWTENRWFR